MKDIKLVIFDCDGVMFDTVKANTAFYNRILAHFGKPEMTPEQFDFVHMHTVNESVANLFDDEKEREAANVYRKAMSYDPFFKEMEIEPYLKPLLENLRPEYKTAIATNRTDTMDRVLSEFGLEDDFDLVVTALDVDRPKPYPDELVKILEHFKTESHQAVYVGDSQLDEIAAKGANIPLIAYDNPSLDGAFHIKSLREIEEILDVSS
ncbi:HAD family hydrolase [Desulfonema magnum]|uniref:phosphoglycolate phosphatase n=1 Tax=Desulfonema magnum TaxID=45655 RepID=A0A975GMH0_9BACT|nr:HAD-IA family hydrolase [Desulfonema magnum]QTA86655.1 HAD hydrolase domain-containing protein [Desulfonema magnum]